MPPPDHLASDEEQLAEAWARIKHATLALAELEPVFTIFRAQARRLREGAAPLCSIREAARRMGKSDGYLRGLLQKRPDLAARVLVGGGGQRMIRWPALERWLLGDDEEVDR